MRPLFVAAAMLLLLLCPPLAAAQPEEPPLAGRPPDFSWLVGRHDLSAHAEPKAVTVGEPILLHVRITGNSPEPYQPRRDKLKIFPPGLEDDFFVEPLPDRDRHLKETKTWEFTWRLRPRSERVKEIPSLKLWYFAFGRYQYSLSDPIPLTVKPPPPPAIVAPARLYHIATGPAVLRTEEREILNLPLLLFGLLAAPAGCLLWYQLWRQLYPDEGEQKRRRHGRAARQALQALHRLHANAAAEEVAAPVVRYLRDRYGLRPLDPTPQELHEHLRHCRLSAHAVAQAVAFFQSCHGARFAPANATRLPDLQAQAVALIELIERETGQRPTARRADQGTPAAAATLAALTLAALAVAPAAFASVTRAEAEKLLDGAEAAFRRGVARQAQADESRQSFAEAAKLYAQLRSRGIANPDLFRNLGNAEFLAGRLPHAVLAWRQGLDLAPGDTELQENLAYVRRQVPYPTDGRVRPPEFAWPAGVPFPGLSVFTVAFLLMYALLCAALTRYLMVRRSYWLILAGVCLALGGLFGIFLARWHLAELNDDAHPLAVIAAEAVPLYRGNAESYPAHPDVPTLYRGMEARVRFERGEWLQIEFATGQVGWVPRSAVLVRGAPR